MKFIPNEIVGTIRGGRYCGMDSESSCRVRFFDSNDQFEEEVIVPVSLEEAQLLRNMKSGAWVWVKYSEGKAGGIQFPINRAIPDPHAGF
jgi:hypothetical protein